MSNSGLFSSEEFLTQAGAKYFSEIYENPTIKFHEKVDPALHWCPSLHFKANNHLKIIGESSELLYPLVFRLSHADILAVNEPISVFCICPEEIYLQESKQPEVNDLRAHGYGLLTVDKNGKVTKRFTCIPLIQHLPEAEFNSEIKDLPSKLRVRLKDAYENYNHNSGAGVKALTEIVEELVINAGKKMVTKNWINQKTLNGPLANLLDGMTSANQCRGAIAAIGGARSYISDYRNTSHHVPRNKKQAFQKFRDCLHAFRDGLKKIQNFRTAMKNLAINISI